MSSHYSLVVFFSFPCKRLVDNKYSRRSKDLLKEFHHHFVCCSHPCLTRIRFKGSNGMDHRHDCLYFIASSFFSERVIFPLFFIKIYLFVFIAVHQICVLNKAGIKLAQIGRSILTTYSQCTLER